MGSKASTLLHSSGFRGRVLFVILSLIVYRFGCYVTLPGVDSSYMEDLFQGSIGSGFLGMFNLFSGGALGRMTVFALNIMPYIVSSIILQISVSALKIEGRISEDFDSKRISFYSKLMTVALSFVQGLVIIIGLQKMGAFSADNTSLNLALSVVTLVGGTMFLVWLGDQITNNGIGNGISLIIFTGIVAEIPSSLSNVLSLWKFADGGLLKIVVILVLFFLTLILIVLCERSYRCVNVSYPRRQVRNVMYKDSFSHIPIKINMSGVIPPIFANAMLLFPLTIAGFSKESVAGEFILRNLTIGQPLYILLYVTMIIFFCFFYNDFVFNTKEISETLKRNGGIIIGKRPGKLTKEYLDFLIKRITVIGAIYLALVCIVPEFIRSWYYIPFAIGGTSLLIVVNVVIESFMQIQTYLFTSQYSNFLKKRNLSNCNRVG